MRNLKTRLKKIIFVLMASMLSLPTIGVWAEQDFLSLEGLIKEAQSNNPDILAAKKRWESSKARIPQMKSLDNPTVGFEFEKIPRSTFQLNNVMPDDRMLSFAQMFPFIGKLSLKGKIALVESQMFASEYKAKELEIINAVKNAYYELFMNNKETELNKQNLELLKSLTHIVEAKYSVGESSQEEAYKLHIEMARLATAIANLGEENNAQKTRINTLLNRAPEAPLGIPEIGEDTFLKKDIESLYKLAMLNQPELIIFSYAVEKNKYAKSLAKKSPLPDIMAQATLRGISSGMTGAWDLMLAFTVPFWFWTKQRYEIKEAIANLEEAEAAYQAMKNKAFSEVKDEAARAAISKNKVSLYKTSLIPLLESSLEVSFSSLRSGKAEVMALLDNLRMLIEAKMEYYKALVEYHMHIADLERMVGVSLTGQSEVRK